jgi:hypothetical protein
MNVITTFTKLDDVRSILGVSEEELTDLAMYAEVYATRLTEELTDLSGTLITQYLAKQSLLTPTAAEERLVKLVQAYSGYVFSGYLLAAMPMFAPKTIKDNAAQMERVVDPYAGLREDINSTLSYLKTKVLASLLVVSPGAAVTLAVSRTMVVNVGLAVDPVTGV